MLAPLLLAVLLTVAWLRATLSPSAAAQPRPPVHY